MVGRLVLESVKRGKKPGDWTGEALARFDARFQPEMVRLMNPSEGMKTRTAAGGTAPETVRHALDAARKRLESRL